MLMDVWEDLHFMGGLISSLYLEVKGCLWGLGRWYKTPKPERSNLALFKSRYQGTKEVLQKVDQRSWGKEHIVKGGLSLSIHEVFDMSCGE